uniref:Serum amyloid A like 1 n=1 Tax=Poecilia mexicana TaxID=48701 RepID=A0A3B3XJV5_9TELE
RENSSVDGAEPEENERSPPPAGPQSPHMDRNPSPPPDQADGDEGEDLDAIGDTVYSKHWLFSTLTRLIQVENSEDQMQLSDDDEEDLCRVWDMAMDKDVAGFLQEFKAADILLGVIAKSHCPRLTEICVGILGNIACFPDTCATLSQNEDLGAVLLLLLGDADPPTLLETSRLLLTCLSQKDFCSLWLQRIRQQTSVCSSLCFIMSSSTNTDLLEKVGELIDKLFDLDEELMKCWITSRPSDEKERDGDISLELSLCLLEAAKQLRSESPDGLEVYLHIFQLLTTVEEGIQVFAAPDGPGKPLWEFVSDVLCEDLCQPNDLPVVLHEQKSILIQALSVLVPPASKLLSPSLIGSVFRVCQHQSESKKEDSNKDEANDDQLQTLAEITSEFLADICLNITKVINEILQFFSYYHRRTNDDLTQKTCQAAAACLLPNFKTSVSSLFRHITI